MSYATLNIPYLWENAIQMGSWVVMSGSLPFLYSAHTIGSPWPLPPFPSSGPWCRQQSCCSPWMYKGTCTQINAHMYTHVCLSYLVHAPDSLFHRFWACPHLGIRTTRAWPLWSIPWALGVSEKRLRCLWGCFATPEMQEEQCPFSSVEELFL